MLDKLVNGLNRMSQCFKPTVRANIVLISPSKTLEGKKILITGGNRGIGFEIAKKCISEGADVIITGRDINALKKAAETLNFCHYIQFDHSNLLNIASLFDRCEDLLNSSLDCLVNNAGISLHEGNILNVTMETWDKQFDTNLKAPYFLSQEFIRRFNKFNKSECIIGKILFITSERGLYCDDIPYGLIKAAINSLTAGLGRRLLERRIIVNAIAPGVTASKMTGYSKDGDLYREIACAKRIYLPEEVAELASFLLSDCSNCISSQVIPCNNGNHLRCDW